MMMKETPLGLFGENNNLHIAFFKKNISLTDVTQHFPQADFHRLVQTHSDISALASEQTLTSDPTLGPSKTEGDSLVASGATFRGALGISTADCLPVILVSKNKLAGVHAGWRGVENEIIYKTLQNHFAAEESISAYVGPHIQWSSFEVDRELGEKFLIQYQEYASLAQQQYKPEMVLKASATNSEKSYINLSVIARCQLMAGGVSAENIWISNIDTKTDHTWASFRREGRNMGKNLSFVSRRNS
ncbi:MAG: polyphenol oxidase family protein [Bdellovibrionota bacterium]